jgi:hypothetical protein
MAKAVLFRTKARLAFVLHRSCQPEVSDNAAWSVALRDTMW